MYQVIVVDSVAGYRRRPKWMATPPFWCFLSIVLVGTQQVVGCAAIVCFIFENRVLDVVNWVSEIGQCLDSFII